MDPAPLTPARPAYEVVGRYAIFDEIAAGGMATVHLGKLVAAGGFSRVVAIKRLHPQFSKDAEFSAMFLDEARLAARIRHANVVQTLDVVTVRQELLLVMEYVHGVSFAALLHASRKARQRVDPRIAAAVVAGALEGLHAAHEVKSESGAPLGVVHRDVSPQNVMVGADGVPRILDFGVAKAMGKMHATREGQLKGKLAYMSPEQVRSQDVTRQSDVFSTAIVLWEALMGQRLFDGNNPAELIMQVLSEPIEPPRSRYPDLPAALDAVVMKALARDPRERHASAREMALELEAAVGLAPTREVARWAEGLATDTLQARSQLVERIERATSSDEPARSGSGLAYAATLDASPGAERIGSELRARLKGFPSTPPSPIDNTLPSPATPSPYLGDARERPPTYLGEADRSEPRPISGAGPVAARRIPTTIEPEEERISLRERLESPLKVVAAGVLLSVADPLARPYLGTFPVRPLWVAEILVVAGVLWVIARLVLPVRSPRD